mmetsp:Transcript_110223/g.310913  ORF Transcript_110223/g.310913 Transcript_110223/m.310913 type:complete len:254 (-) Transcript_110223:1298-2059(-)
MSTSHASGLKASESMSRDRKASTICSVKGCRRRAIMMFCARCGAKSVTSFTFSTVAWLPAEGVSAFDFSNNALRQETLTCTSLSVRPAKTVPETRASGNVCQWKRLPKGGGCAASALGALPLPLPLVSAFPVDDLAGGGGALPCPLLPAEPLPGVPFAGVPFAGLPVAGVPSDGVPWSGEPLPEDAVEGGLGVFASFAVSSLIPAALVERIGGACPLPVVYSAGSAFPGPARSDASDAAVAAAGYAAFASASA